MCMMDYFIIIPFYQTLQQATALGDTQAAWQESPWSVFCIISFCLREESVHTIYLWGHVPNVNCETEEAQWAYSPDGVFN